MIGGLQGIGKKLGVGVSQSAHGISAQNLSSQEKAYRKDEDKEARNQAYLDSIEINEKVLEENPEDEGAKEALECIYFEYADFLAKAGPNPLQENTPIPTKKNNAAIESFQSKSKASAFEARINALLTQPPFFVKLSQPASSIPNYTVVTRCEAVQETRHLAWCLHQENLSERLQKSLLDQAYEVLEQFVQRGVKQCAHIQELVALGSINHAGLHRKITEALLGALEPERNAPVDLGLLYALSVMILLRSHLKQDAHSAGDAVVLLKALLVPLQQIQVNQNLLQVRALLHTVSMLLDYMVDFAIQDLDSELHRALMQALKKLKNACPDLTWSIEYIQQALVNLPKNETFWDKVEKYVGPSMAGLLYLTGGIFKIIAANTALPGSPLSAIIVAGVEPDRFLKALESLREGLSGISLDRSQPWYVQLRLMDLFFGVGVAAGRLDLLEATLDKASNPYHENFLRGLCDRLERLACAQVELSMQEGALRLLKALSEGRIAWGKREAIKLYARATLDRISQWQNLVMSDMERNAYAPPAWHAFWHAAPSNTLLQIARDKARQDANLQSLSGLITDMAAIKAFLHPPSSDVASQWTQIRATLCDYYQSSLLIQRISGDALELASCYINLAIVEAPLQREKEKQALQKQSSVFHRISSYERVAESNLHALIKLEELFDERMLRNGVVGAPKKILIQGRAGIGKTTLCKKLVYEYSHNGLWKNRFDAVLWLPLRQLKNYTARNLEALLCEKYFSQHPDKEAFASILSQRANKILFILDGLDEVSTELGQDSPLGDFLTTLLKHANVLLTSRPSGIESTTLEQVDLELETIGFSSKNVQDYLNKAEPVAATAIHSFIQRTPLIQELVNIPVQLDVLCYSWDAMQSSNNASGMATMTELYQAMVNKLWHKDSIRLGKTSQGVLLKLHDIQNLSEKEVEAQLVSAENDYLGYLAFQGLQDTRIEFDLSYLKQLKDQLNQVRGKELPLQLSHDLKQTSFLHTADAHLREYDRSYHFLHLTFQEFFAAKWLARHIAAYLGPESGFIPDSTLTLSKELTKDFVQQHKYDPRYEIVWPMVAGLLKDKSSTLEAFFDLLEQEPQDLLGIAQQRLLMGCLQEARAGLNKARIEKIESNLGNWLDAEIKITAESLLGRQPAFPESLLLKRLLSKSAEKIKTKIIMTLGARPTLSEKGLKGLTATIKDTDPWVSKAAVKALGAQLSLPISVLTQLSELALKKEKDQALRAAAIDVLATQLALSPAMLNLLSDLALDKEDDEEVRVAAIQALGRQQPLPLQKLECLSDLMLKQEESGRVRVTAVRALGAQSPLPLAMLECLIALVLLEVESEWVRVAVLEVLGAQQSLPPMWLEKLSELVRKTEENEWVKVSVIHTLGEQPFLPDMVLKRLIALVRSKNESDKIRSAVIEALGKVPDVPEEVLECLSVLSQAEKEWVRIAAARALCKQLCLPFETQEHLVASVQIKKEKKRISEAVVDSSDTKLSLPTVWFERLMQKLKKSDALFADVEVVAAPDLHSDTLYRLLPTLNSDRFIFLFTNILVEQSFSNVMPLYIKEQQLYFYTAKGMESISLLSPNRLRRYVQRAQKAAGLPIGLEKLERFEESPLNRNPVLNSWLL